MKKSNKIQENAFRSLVRNEIAKVLREEEGDEQVPEKEKEEKPKQDRGDILDKLTYTYTKSAKNNLQNLSSDEMADAIDAIMSNFGLGKDSKMDVLRTVKNKIQQ